MRLFIFITAPFVVFILFVQSMRLLNTLRNKGAWWRGGLRTREENPATYWTLIVWNVAIMIAVVFIYGHMILREF